MPQNFNIKKRFREFRATSAETRARTVREFFINHLLYILLFVAIIGITIYDPRFLSLSSIINIISLSAANLPIALGIAGCIILMGTDLSA